MSFAIHEKNPGFIEAVLDDKGAWTGAGLNPGELIYFEVSPGIWEHFDSKASIVPKGARFCISTKGLPTQAQIDAEFAPPSAKTLDQKLAAIGLTAADIKAAAAQP